MKTFIAAMLAVYIALAIGLDRPYWAMATVYIVSQPLTGALRSKALYRLLGTTIGAAATIVLVLNLVDAPELLCAVLALWTGFCLYIALLDRERVFDIDGRLPVLIDCRRQLLGPIWHVGLPCKANAIGKLGVGIFQSPVSGCGVRPSPAHDHAPAENVR